MLGHLQDKRIDSHFNGKDSTRDARIDAHQLMSDSTFLTVALTSSPGRMLVRFQPCAASAQSWLLGELTEKRTTRPSFFT